MGGLDADRLRQRVGHGAVVEGADQPAPPVHAQVARGPERGGPDVSQEHSVIGGDPVDGTDGDLGVDRPAIPVGVGERVQALASAVIVRGHPSQVGGVACRGQVRQQRGDGVLDRADQRDVHGDAPVDVLAADIDLDHPGVLGVEGPVGEVSAEHQERVAVLHRAISRREPEQTGHADVIGVVVLDELLAAQRVDDRRLELLGHRDQLVVCSLAAGAGEDGDVLGGVENVRGSGQRIIGGADHRR
jgi:hypothetical protein